MRDDAGKFVAQCPTCKGSGAVDDVHGLPWSEQWDKPETLFPRTCAACGGTGRVPERRARGRAR